MILRLQFPDDLYDTYCRRAEEIHQGAGETVAPTDLMISILERFRLVNPADRVIVVDGRTRSQLESVLSGGTLRDAEDLLQKVEGFASLRIGDIRLDFTPGQMRELKHIADRNRRSVEDLFVTTVHRMSEQFFRNVDGTVPSVLTKQPPAAPPSKLRILPVLEPSK